MYDLLIYKQQRWYNISFIIVAKDFIDLHSEH